MMKIFSLGTQLEPVSREIFENSGDPAVVVANSEEAREALKLLDVLGSSYKMLFLVNENHMVIIDDDDFAQCIIRRIRQKKAQQGVNKAHFIYNFILQFMSRDLQILGQYERQIMAMEEQVMEGKTEGFQSKIMPIRKELLTVISTIFFPLTLITGWFGMNFENMPGLKGGYPGVIILSLVVVTGCILFFKKKKML